MLYDQTSWLHLAWAAFAVVISYPLLYWFLRRVKRVPLRFNVTVFAAVVAAGLLPLEIISFEVSRTAVQLDMIAALLSAEQRINDKVLVCDVDPRKVRPEQIEMATRRLADSTTTWFHAQDMNQITGAQWLKLENKCDGWQPINSVGRKRTDSYRAAQWWLFASVVTGLAGVMAMYALVVSRVREDMRDVQVEDRVELKSSGEVVMAFFICLIAFLPFSLLWLRLFKYPKSANKESRASAQ